MKVLRLRSWNFHAENLDAMTRFYQNALGAELRTQHTVGGIKVNRLRAGETGLGLFDASEKLATGVPHHTFDIESPGDPQELIKELEAKGIKVNDLRLHGEGPWYVTFAHEALALYGVLGGLMFFFFWLYYASLVFVLGAEVGFACEQIRLPKA